MIISPSILAADFLNLEKEIKRLNDSDCEFIHLDVMDGNFVPNITFGVDLIKNIKKITSKKLDVHLMVENPTFIIEQLVDLKVDIITLHVEILQNVDFNYLLDLCNKNNVTLGIAFNPDTKTDDFINEIKKVDFILLMSVQPGLGGQKFREEVLKKAKEILKVNSKMIINIDGGVSDKNIKKIKNAKISMVVAGTYIFKGDMNTNIKSLKR